MPKAFALSAHSGRDEKDLMKKGLIGLIFLVVLGGGLYLFLSQIKPKEAPPAPAPVLHGGIPVRKGMVFKARKKRPPPAVIKEKTE